MPDYSKGKIYTIRCRIDDSLIYVGSTVNTLTRRFTNHKGVSESRKCPIHYKMEEMGFNNWYIELYELYPCNSKIELNKREGEIIRLIGTLNRNISGQSKDEYRKSDKGKEVEKKGRLLYYKNNQEQIREIHKLYRENNKDVIKERYCNNNIDITCECGSIIKKYKITVHRKSKKHLKFIK